MAETMKVSNRADFCVGYFDPPPLDWSSLRVRIISHSYGFCIVHQVFDSRATLRIRKRHAASLAQASELASFRSKSLAKRRQRTIQANVRSTTQRRGQNGEGGDLLGLFDDLEELRLALPGCTYA